MERRNDRLTAVEPVALGRVGVPATDRQRIAGVLVDRELCGYEDRGLPLLPVLLRYFREGRFNPAPDVRVLQDGPAVTLLDGDRGAGVLTAAVTTETLLVAAGQNLKRWLAATGWGRRHPPCGALAAPRCPPPPAHP